MTAESYPLAWPPGWPRGLTDELRRIGATNIVVSTNQPIRRDGYPYAQERIIPDTGVAVYFMRGGKPLVMAQDRFWSVIGNMRSLTMSIEGLRQMERHGGATMMERAFDGFVTLTAPGKNWWDVLEVKPDATRDVIEANFRRLARDKHPDNGGSHEAMSALNEARAAALRARA